MLQLDAKQIDLYEKMAFAEKLDKSFCKQFPDFAELDDNERATFLVDCMFAADQLGFKTEQGVASYALAAYWLEIGFEKKSRDLQVLLSSDFSEVRKTYAMNEWVHTILGDPENPAAADEALKQAFFRSSAFK